ncbi:IS110 family transposase [Lactiplantibacillus modestisalitolerans]|uniref:IS110 family transposase n=1 Tax=Lactiplantibacillus modestisalitolerans TaxID=1457219 RepID=A0ABV5WX72_9LACO|nr:IS110 family transposase [Lactiplantibacillus modestisalitolerans]
MQIVFGIDISSESATVAIANSVEENGKSERMLLKEYKIDSNKVGFSRLLRDLHNFTDPQIIFEATGVYSRRFRAFLNRNEYKFTELNPLQAKLDLHDTFRHQKTDSNDARDLAFSQCIKHRLVTVQEHPVYLDLRDDERFYQQLTCDVVRKKNELERALQLVFPGIQGVYSDTYGENLCRTLQLFPHPNLVLAESLDSLTTKLQKGLAKKLSRKVCQRYAQRLMDAAKQSSPAIEPSSCILDQTRYYGQALLALATKQAEVINRMVKKAKEAKLPELAIYQSIPGIGLKTAVCLTAELGDLHRFTSSSKINAYVGIDLVVYESGNYRGERHITKHGNPYARKLLFRTVDSILSVTKKFQSCHIADFYRRKKESSGNKPATKKIHIATIGRLLRTMYHLVLHNQEYNYKIATTH